jgi:hypothetical protein
MLKVYRTEAAMPRFCPEQTPMPDKPTSCPIRTAGVKPKLCTPSAAEESPIEAPPNQ